MVGLAMKNGTRYICSWISTILLKKGRSLWRSNFAGKLHLQMDLSALRTGVNGIGLQFRKCHSNFHNIGWSDFGSSHPQIQRSFSKSKNGNKTLDVRMELKSLQCPQLTTDFRIGISDIQYPMHKFGAHSKKPFPWAIHHLYHCTKIQISLLLFTVSVMEHIWWRVKVRRNKSSHWCSLLWWVMR